MSLYWPMRAGFAVSRHLPLSLRYALGTLGGEAAYWCWPSKRRNTRRNMAVVAGGPVGCPHADALARASLRRYGRYIIDFFNLPHLSPTEVERRLRVDGWEHLEQALERGKGVIFASGHVGAYDYASMIVARRYPGRMHIVAEPFDSPRIDDLIQGQRMAKGTLIVPMTSVRRMVRVLRDNGILAVLVDRPVEGDGVPVTFFGRRTMVPAGAATLAAMTGATVIPGYLIHRDNGLFDGRLFPPISMAPSGDRAADARALTQRIFTALESIIARNPEHWYMFRDMWRDARVAAAEVTA